jgi:hypothetical protein
MIFTAFLIPAAAFVLQTTACDTNASPREQARKGSSVGETISRPGGANNALTITRDPENGSLQLASDPPYKGEWNFLDVTASNSERAMGGTTVKTLTIEAHQVPPNEHLKLRMSRKEADIDAGKYSIDAGDGGRSLDVTWEHGDQRFRSLSPATGSVTITEITADRVKGTYEVKLAPMAENEPPVTLTGQFDTKIQR